MVMGSLYLNGLSAAERDALVTALLSSQNSKCFICERPIDRALHATNIDVDHVEPLKAGGKDNPENFAATHAACNRSKQATDLRVARVLARFARVREHVEGQGRGPHFGDVLAANQGGRFPFALRVDGDHVEVSFSEIGEVEVVRLPLYSDRLSGFRYFFVEAPIDYLHHDDRINPRALGASLPKLVDEFHRKRPQLHICLAWTSSDPGEGPRRLAVFDGQHKATAQVLLGSRRLPVRVFVDPDLDTLLTANTNAGTSLRQIAFDKSVQRHLGSALFQDRLNRFRSDRGLPDDDEAFSEKDLVAHFRGERREMQRYILDAVRDAITHNTENRLKDYVEFGGKGKDKPLSYSAMEKTFYSFFIYSDLLETPLNHRLDEGQNPRELEKEQILKLMNVVSKHVLEPHFDGNLGTSKIENRVQKGEDISDGHLRAIRMVREEILYSWLRFVRQIVQNYFITIGTPIYEDKLFQYKFPEPLWDNLEAFIASLVKLPLWVNRELSLSVFGGKQNYEYWQMIFESGKTPQGQTVMPEGLNLMKMIQRPNA